MAALRANRSWHALFGGALASSVLACSLIKSFDGFEGGSLADAGQPEATPASFDAGDETCARTSWPPTPERGSGADIGARVVALRSLQLLGDGTSSASGMNLDGLCTCPEKAGCRGASRDDLCDADGGVDNAAFSVFEDFSRAGVGLDDRGLRAGIEQSRYNILFRINGYNGEPDDPEVIVQVFDAFALEGKPVDTAPRFDGTDTWRIDHDSLPDGNLAVFTSMKAWVANGVLVAEIPALTLKLRVPSATGFQLIMLRLVEARITATIAASEDLQAFSLADGVLAGRLPPKSVLEQVQINGICTDSPTYEIIKTRVCNARDVALVAGDDGRDMPCGAISIGARFAATAARLGTVGTPDDAKPCTLASDDCPN